jgi:hypothetical protein
MAASLPLRGVLNVEIAEQMERFDAHVGAADSTLEKTPEVFQSVRMHAIIDILLGMDLVREVSAQPIIGKQRIGIQSTLSGNMILKVSLHLLLAPIRNVSKANLSVTLQYSHNNPSCL